MKSLIWKFVCSLHNILERKKSLILCHILLFLTSLFALQAAAQSEFDSYRRLETKTSDNRNVVSNPAFDVEDGRKDWFIGTESEISALHGRNQRGLGIVRRDKNAYSVNFQKLKLKPQTKYEAGVWIRNQNFDPSLHDVWLGNFGIEWYKDGQILNGTYARSPGNHDWMLYKLEFTTLPDPAIFCI